MKSRASSKDSNNPYKSGSRSPNKPASATRGSGRGTPARSDREGFRTSPVRGTKLFEEFEKEKENENTNARPAGPSTSSGIAAPAGANAPDSPGFVPNTKPTPVDRTARRARDRDGNFIDRTRT